MRNSDNDPEPTADEAITTSAPSPVVTSNNFELVNLLKDWIDSHPNLRIPELSKYDRNSLEDNFALEASLVETGARVWILRLGVMDMYQGWVLEKPDGSKMLVRSHYRKGGHVYYGWLGGELGYSDEVIAHHQDVPRLVLSLRLYARRKKLDAEDVLNEYDVSKEALEFENRVSGAASPAAAGGAIEESDTALSSPPSESDSDDPLVNVRASRKRAFEKANTSTSKKRTKLSISPTSKSEGANDLLAIDDVNVRAKVKKLHKVFPALTIAVCECVLLKNKGNVDNALDDLYGLQTIPSTSTASTVSVDSPPAQATRSQRAKPTGNPPCTPSPARTKNSNTTTHLATPFSSAHSPSSSLTYPPTPHTPSSLLLRTPSQNQPTTLKFFLADPTLGAVPIPYHSIKSRQKFFSEAIAAHFLTSGGSVSETERESVVAVSVVVMGMEGYPIVVRRGKGGNVAWEQVGRVVGEEERVRGGGGGVEVEVRCVVQSVGEGG